jgi:hypothetical protein
MSNLNSMGSGVMMMGDGPNFTGTWYNINTGDSFTVRDTFFEDNKIKIQTTDGRIIGYEQLQNYVQSEVPITKNNIPIPTGDGTMSNKVNISSQNDSNLSDNNLLRGLENASQMSQNRLQNENWKIIDKAMSKIENGPRLEISVLWDNYPSKEISLLKDIMDIPEKDIVEYCYDKWLDGKTNDAIFESFSKLFEKNT